MGEIRNEWVKAPAGKKVAAFIVLAIGAFYFIVAMTSHDTSDDVDTAMVAFCDGVFEESMTYLSSAGVSSEGKAWARQTLDTWPEQYQDKCDRKFIEEMASGAVDARMGAQSSSSSSPSRPTVNADECERRIATMADLDIDSQSKADNIDSIRIDCDLPPLQQTPFWAQAWERHQAGTSP